MIGFWDFITHSALPLLSWDVPWEEGVVKPPAYIDGYAIVEYGYFPHSMLPTGYVPPQDGSPLLQPVQNLAICTADGIDGYYLLFCTPDWLSLIHI